MRGHSKIRGHQRIAGKGPTDSEIDRAVVNFVSFAQRTVAKHEQEQGLVSSVLTIMWGAKYARIVKDKSTVFGFVDRTNGNILKAAGWKRPTKHARGNVLDKNTWKSSHNEYGMAYMRSASKTNQEISMSKYKKAALLRLARRRPDLRPRIARELRKMRLAKEKYPWDQCIKDQMKQYGDMETAKKVCGKIRAKSQGKKSHRALTHKGSAFKGEVFSWDKKSDIEMSFNPFTRTVLVGMGGEKWYGKVKIGTNTFHHEKERFDPSYSPVTVIIEQMGHSLRFAVMGGPVDERGYEQGHTFILKFKS